MNLPPKADGINSASVTCGSYDTKERKLIPPVRQVSRILGYLEYFLCRCVLLHLFCNQGMTVDRETDRKKPCRGRGGIAPLLRARGLKCFCHESEGGVGWGGKRRRRKCTFRLVRSVSCSLRRLWTTHFHGVSHGRGRTNPVIEGRHVRLIERGRREYVRRGGCNADSSPNIACLLLVH